MATAISYTSASSVHYLSLITANVVSVEDIVAIEKAKYGGEFVYLFVDCVQSQDVNTLDLKQALTDEIDKYYKS